LNYESNYNKKTYLKQTTLLGTVNLFSPYARGLIAVTGLE